MVDTLAIGANTFAQDRTPWLPRAGGLPGCRRVEAMHVVTVRHRAGSELARDALAVHGLEWPEATGDVGKAQPEDTMRVVRLQPEELVVVGAHSPAIDGLLAALSPGRAADAVAIDVSDGAAVVELEGPSLDPWLAHLVDALAIPRHPGRATRARMADIAVMLVRVDEERLWLVADRSLASYVANWLTFAHQGAFESRPSRP